MTVGVISVITTIVTTGAKIMANKKAAKKKAEADQQTAYIEGSAPIIPQANQLDIESIGEEAVAAGADAPDFRDSLAGTYGSDYYESQEFNKEGAPQEIPPELEALLMQQQTSGQEPTNVQFANSGGPVGLPQDVYYFSMPKINQMTMDQDPGVRNVGNAMMGQMEGNPGMGMVGASAADIDQMAAGGPVRPKKYQDGSDGGLRGYLSMEEMPEDATDYDKRMQLQLIANEMQRNAANSDGFTTSSFRDDLELIEHPETGELIPVIKGQEYYGPMTSPREDKLSPDRIEEILEMMKSQNRHLSDKDREMLGLPMAAGGPVQPRRYAEGSDGGLDIFAMLDQRAEDEGRLTGRDMEREYLLETMNAPSEDPFSAETVQDQRRLNKAEEAAENFLYSNQNWKIEAPEQSELLSLQTGPPNATGKEVLELTDKGVLHNLLERVGNIGSNFSKGIKLENRFDQGPLEKLLKERGVSYNFDKERKPFFGRKRQGGLERRGDGPKFGHGPI